MISMDSVTSLWVLCYLVGRIVSLVEPVVSTIFKFFYYERYVQKGPYRRGVGKASSEFTGAMKASVRWFSTPKTSGGRNEVKDSVN